MNNEVKVIGSIDLSKGQKKELINTTHSEAELMEVMVKKEGVITLTDDYSTVIFNTMSHAARNLEEGKTADDLNAKLKYRTEILMAASTHIKSAKIKREDVKAMSAAIADMVKDGDFKKEEILLAREFRMELMEWLFLGEVHHEEAPEEEGIDVNDLDATDLAF